MTRTLGRAGFVFSAGLSIALVFAHGGCSSSSSGPTPCAATPVPPAQDTFCTALASYDGRCGHCDDCTAKNLQNCTKRSGALSDVHRAAFVGCKDSASCGADPAFSACVEQQMKNATPTDAQSRAKDDYCNRCNATNAADCTNFFLVDPGSGKTGAGYGILLYNDDIAARAPVDCAAECDPFRYAVCVALLACGPSGGDYCADGGFCAVR